MNCKHLLSVSLGRSLLIFLLSLPLVGCVFHTYAVTDSPEYPLELSILYDSRCVGTIRAAGKPAVNFHGRLFAYLRGMEREDSSGVESRSIHIGCDIEVSRTQTRRERNFVSVIYIDIYFKDYIENFRENYFGEYLMFPEPSPHAKSDGQSGHFQLAQKALLLEIAKASNEGILAPFQGHEFLPTDYTVTLVGRAASDLFKRPRIANVTCPNSDLFSKSGVLSISPINQYKPDGVYATISAAMVIGGARCI